MPQPITAATLLNKFISEQEYIQRYLAFLQDKSLITPFQVDRQIDELVQLGLVERRGPLDTRHLIPDVRSWIRPYDWSTLEQIHAMIIESIPRMERAIQTAELKAQQTELPPQLDRLDIDSRSLLGELVQYALDALEGHSTGQYTSVLYQKPTKEEEPIQTAFSELDSYLYDPYVSHVYREMKESLETNQREQGDEFAIFGAAGNKLSIDEAVKVAIASARYILPRRNLERLLGAKQDVNDFDLAVRMAKPDAEINTFRQAFINLMTLFDATLFDIVRVAFRNNFFKVLAGFVTDDKLSMGELSKYGSFERLQDAIAEQRLKGLYVKDLLFILQDKLHVNLVSGEDRFVQLIELVLRRNIHLHNRGTVDDKYLELNQSGKPQYNIYNLARGSVATIDAPYWEAANRLCKNAITAAAQWADSL